MANLIPALKGIRQGKSFDDISTHWAMFHVDGGCADWESLSRDTLEDILSEYFQAVDFYQSSGSAGQTFTHLGARFNPQGRLIVYMNAGLDV